MKTRRRIGITYFYYVFKWVVWLCFLLHFSTLLVNFLLSIRYYGWMQGIGYRWETYASTCTTNEISCPQTVRSGKSSSRCVLWASWQQARCGPFRCYLSQRSNAEFVIDASNISDRWRYVRKNDVRETGNGNGQQKAGRCLTENQKAHRPTNKQLPGWKHTIWPKDHSAWAWLLPHSTTGPYSNPNVPFLACDGLVYLYFDVSYNCDSLLQTGRDLSKNTFPSSWQFEPHLASLYLYFRRVMDPLR